MDKAMCPVVKNQIVGLQVPANNLSDFSWTVNGELLDYKRCFFDGCRADQQTNMAFFPVLDNPGAAYEIRLSATEIDSGKKISLTKMFIVTDPEIKISSDNQNLCYPALLGYYTDTNGKKWPDYSQYNFIASAHHNVPLRVDFTGFVPSSENFAWRVDGLLINSDNVGEFGFILDNENRLLTLHGKAIDESYQVEVAGIYAPDNLAKKALNKYWDVRYTDFYETRIGDAITVSFRKASEAAMNNNQTKGKILAFLYGATPAYLAFLLRIVL